MKLALAGHSHVPKLVRDAPFRVNRVWRCRVCGAAMYEVPA